MLKLVLPKIYYKEDCLDFKNEHFINNESSISGDGGLSSYDFEEWLVKVERYHNNHNIPNNRVPASTFLAYDNDRLVGIIDIRHYLNEYLRNYGGHIGYSIRPSERLKGYGKAMLGLALKYCEDELKLNKVLLTCDKSNIGSQKTIIANGGIFDSELYDENEKSYKLRYWISLH